MGSFQDGFRQGGDSWNNAEKMRLLQAQDEREAVAHDLRMKEGGLRLSGAQRVDSATQALTSGMQNGITDPNAVAQNNADLQFDDDWQQGGMQLPKATGPQRSDFRKATDADIAQLGGALAAAKGDYAGLKSARADSKQFNLDREDRDFIVAAQKLEAAAKSGDPAAISAWKKHVEPYTNMASQYSHFDGDVRVNPKTGAIEVVPYDSSKPVQAVSFLEAMPTLMQTRRLSSEYGSPAAAVDALHAMSDKEREKAMKRSEFTLGRADKLSQSVHRANDDTEKARHNKALEGITAQHYGAQADKSRMGATMQMIGPQGDPVIVQPVMGRDGKVTYVQADLPPGLRLPKQVDPARIEARAQALVGKPTGRLVAGKPELYTDATAYDAAYAQVAGQSRGGAAGELPEVKAPARNAGGGGEKPPAKGLRAQGGDNIGQSPIGILTSRNALEDAAAAGNQRAVRALQVLMQNEIDLEVQRGLPMSGY